MPRATSRWPTAPASRTIFRPIEQMEPTMQCVEAGDLEARVGTVGSADEIGRLAQHLDRLLDVVDDKARALQAANADLDAMVAERTRELAAAQSQLLRSEKHAAVGQLTASIAHEVNNPIAVIQDNLDLLRTQLPPAVAQQVLVNLLVNAIHAMPEGGTLGLATQDVSDDSVAITVSDTGAGLDAELMDQLFQPFVTRKKDGTGLGLWISRSLVEPEVGSELAREHGD